MVKRNRLITLGMAVALALPVAPALAAGKGQIHGQTKAAAHSAHARNVRQLEGTVVSMPSDDSSFVLQPMASKRTTVTVAISNGTVVTAAAGVIAKLAVGEQVHVVVKGSDDTDEAVRVFIQKSAADSRALDVNKPKR